MTETSVEPATIGPFVVLRRLGEGAMGVVYTGYDVLLDRKVAIKLVHPSHIGSAAVRGRMIREAQAMARLSSPYVVPLFQVGEHDESLYLAMEYVEGQTLTAWLRAEQRPWPVVLRTICNAGRGLAAAHAAGLVHRDFKPDNVLVDAGGHPRVLDFGLVQTDTDAADSDEPEDAPTEDDQAPVTATLPLAAVVERSSPNWGARLTQPGNAVGTPAYMSPEQHFRRPIGAASDQFSFAVTLYEGLYGARPFVGDSWEQLRRAVKIGTVPPPPPHSRAPRRLFKVIQRGLSLHPEERWPSLDAMIAALEHDPGRKRVRAAVVAGLLAATATTTYALATRVHGVDGPRCQASARELAGVWDDEQKIAVSRAFTATHAPFAADALSRVRSRLDGYADQWIGAHQAACEAHASGVQTGRMMDLRVACLGRRKVHLGALVEQFAAADRAVVENAVQAVAALPSLHDCSDADALIGGPAPPNDPETARRVEELRGQLDRAAVLENTGQYGRGLELATQARAAAEALGHPPLIAEAALVVGRLYMAEARWPEAEAALTEALRLGIIDDLPAVSAEAATRRIFVVGAGQGRPIEALATETFVDALVRRARDDERRPALLHNNLGAVYEARGDADGARVHYEKTIAGLRGRPGPADPILAITHNNLGNMDLDHGDAEAALAHFRIARDLFTAILGPAHPFVAHSLAGLGDAHALKGADTDALTSYVEALARMEAAHGPAHLYLLQPLTGLGQVHAHLGHRELARRHFDRAVAMADDLGIVHLFLARSLVGLAELAATVGDRDLAASHYERALRVYRESGNADAPEAARATLRLRDLTARAPAPPSPAPSARSSAPRSAPVPPASREPADPPSVPSDSPEETPE